MIGALLIVFREVFEAGLIVGIVLAVTRTVPDAISGSPAASRGRSRGLRRRCVRRRLSNLFAGMGQELFNALILTIAVVMLAWHNVWMARHGSEIAGDCARRGRRWSRARSLLALAVVVGVAVLREGARSCCSSTASCGQRGFRVSVALGGARARAGRAGLVLTYAGLVAFPRENCLRSRPC